MEKSREISVDKYDFGSRIYDGRLGRWLSLDPLQHKYAGFSPYNFGLNNPIFYQDVDGRDVGVTIIKGENGKPGKIIFTSTQYVDGDDAEGRVELYTAAFDKFVEANPGLKTSDGQWEVEFQMVFKVATDDDRKRIAKENVAGQAAENLVDVQKPYPGSRSTVRPAGFKYGAGQIHNGKWISSQYDENKPQGSSVAGNKVLLFTNEEDGVIHEVLHTWGLGDRYSDVSYSKKTHIIAPDGKIVRVIKAPAIAARSEPHQGFSKTIMASDGLKLHQTNVDDLANAALKMQGTVGQSSFVMAIKVDGAHKSQVQAVPQVIEKINNPSRGDPNTYKVIYYNPVAAPPGNTP